MKPRLKKLRFEPRGNSGWTSGDLLFGDFLTILFGDNGTGKTPLLNGLAYVLGHPVVIHEQVKKNCSSITLTLSGDSAEWELSRDIQDTFAATATELNSGKSVAFAKEEDLFRWFSETYSISPTEITTRWGKGLFPYMSTLMSLIWINQDHGWATTYYMLKELFKDQEEEMIRLLLNVPPRRPYETRKAFLNKKGEGDLLEQKIERTFRELEDSKRELGDLASESLDSLMQEKKALVKALDDLSSGINSLNQATSGFDAQISEQQRKCDDLESRAYGLTQQKDKLEKSVLALKDESTVLMDNELASSSFRTICENEAQCGLFKFSKNTFARRLLFVKDQIKDIELSSSDLSNEITSIKGLFTAEQERLSEAKKQKDEAVSKSGHERIVASIKYNANLLRELEDKIGRIERHERIRSEYVKHLERREKIKKDASALSPRGGSSTTKTRSVDVRLKFNEVIQAWVQCLNTKNLAGDVQLDENFCCNIGAVQFTDRSEHGGSTRARLILAFHAALLETSLEMDGNHPGFLIFDAPRQHELDLGDLSKYFDRFRELAARHKDQHIQLVISAKDMPTTPKNGDRIWEPSFLIGDRNYFLGVPKPASQA